MSKLVSIASPVCMLALLPGCPLLEVEVEVPSACMTYANVEVAGAADDQATAVSESLVIDDLSAFAPLTGPDSDVRFIRAAVRAIRGVDDVGFVAGATLVLASGDPESELPALVYACDGDCPSSSTELEIPVTPGDSALAYLRSQSLLLELELRGQMPADAWALDVEVCLSATTSYSFEP